MKKMREEDEERKLKKGQKTREKIDPGETRKKDKQRKIQEMKR